MGCYKSARHNVPHVRNRRHVAAVIVLSSASGGFGILFCSAFKPVCLFIYLFRFAPFRVSASIASNATIAATPQKNKDPFLWEFRFRPNFSFGSVVENQREAVKRSLSGYPGQLSSAHRKNVPLERMNSASSVNSSQLVYA